MHIRQCASAKAANKMIHDHYARQATPEVWAEVDELRGQVAKMRDALIRALDDVGCLREDKCPHWIEWHNIARQALTASALNAARSDPPQPAPEPTAEGA